MIEKNDIICAVTDAMGTNGEGIIRHEGITFFVPACLPGEKVRFKVLKVKGNIGYGKVEEILTPAEERVRPKCPVFSRCGGCCLQHLDYNDQLVHKSKVVKDSLRKIGGLHVDVPIAVKSDAPYGYRNKLQLPVGVDKSGENVIGFYAEHSHRIVPVNSCAIHPAWAETLIATLKKYMDTCGVKGYDETTKSGSVRHIVAREIGGNFIVTLVTADRNLPKLSKFVELLQKEFSSFSLYVNLNDQDTNVIFGKEFHLVHGMPFFEGREEEIVYEAGPQTFLQVNENVRAKLYKSAIKTVCKDGDEVVIDAYSGGGLLTAMIAKKAKRVYGIELEREASKCADSLKEKNGLTNMTNICGYVEEHLARVMEKEKGEKVRLILDPPRAGIARSVLKALLQSGIESLTLISCNPATLARDLGILSGRLVENEQGELVKNPAYADLSDGETVPGYYEVEKIQPYDMFPQTKHVETVCLLSKLNAKQHIEINLDMDELDLTDAEKKATYQEIKDYVLEHGGLKVSSLYIAQVKQKCGIIERENYNKPKSEDAKQPQCPPDKEKAIKEALTHFGMI